MTEQKTVDEKTIRALIAFQRKMIIAFSIGLIINFALAAFAVQYVGQVDRHRENTEERRNQQLCAVFGGIDKQYQTTKPATPAAQQFAKDIHDLVESLHCPNN